MGLSGDYTYNADGTVRLDMSDGSSTVMSGAGEDAVILAQATADGTVFSNFDNGDPPRPGHVQFADGNTGDYTYNGDGTVHLSMSDGSDTVLSGSGEDAVILSQTTPDGDVFSNFDADAHPHHVEFAG